MPSQVGRSGRSLLPSRERDVGTFLQSQFEENLGAKVEVRALPFNSLLQQTAAGDYDFYHGGSMAAYNDPMDFLEVWTTDSPLNQSGFTNAEYDRLVEGAKVETNPHPALPAAGAGRKGPDRGGSGSRADVPRVLHQADKTFRGGPRISSLRGLRRLQVCEHPG